MGYITLHDDQLPFIVSVVVASFCGVMGADKAPASKCLFFGTLAVSIVAQGFRKEAMLSSVLSLGQFLTAVVRVTLSLFAVTTQPTQSVEVTSVVWNESWGDLFYIVDVIN